MPPRLQDSDILTLEQIADYLKVSRKTIQRLVQAEEIPAIKVGGQWRFLQEAVMDWLETRAQMAGPESLVNVVTTAEEVIPLSRLVAPDRIVLNIQPGSKREVLSPIVDALVAAGVVGDGAAYLEKLLAREEMVTTAIGSGVAFPHAREPHTTSVTRPCVALGVCPDGTDFHSLDENPTYVVAVCCSCTEVAHLRLLAKLSLLFRDPEVVPALRKAPTKKDVMRRLIKADCALGAAF